MTLEARVLERLREFAGPDGADETGAPVSELVHHPDTAAQVYGALARLRKKGLAVCHRFTGFYGEGSEWLWYPVRPFDQPEGSDR